MCLSPRSALPGRRTENVRQVVSAPVGNPRHAGTDEGDRSLVGGKGSVVRAPRRQPEAVREIESLARCPPRSLPQPRSIFLPRLSSVPLPPSSCLRYPAIPARTFASPRVPTVLRRFLFPFFPFPSLSTGSSRRRPAGFTPANRFNLMYVSLKRARF